MATFKVGQRVRIVSVTNPSDKLYEGMETVVTGPPFDSFGEIAYPIAATFRGAYARNLAPLTDPRAEEFIADMNRFSVAAKKPRYITREDGVFLVTESGERKISK